MARYKVYNENMKWEEFGALRRNERAKLFHKALAGNMNAMKAFRSASKDIVRVGNERLRGLESHNLAYGKYYNNLQYFLNTELDSTRLKSYTALGKDLHEVYYQNEQALKFLKQSTSFWKQAKAVEIYRYNYYKDAGVIPKKTSYRDFKEFLRFLSNEEVTAAIDEYGSSEIIVEIAYTMHKALGRRGLTLMEQALAEFNSGRVDFDTAMERIGIKVEDYKNQKQTS